MEDLKLYALDYRGAVLHEDAQAAWDELEAYVAAIIAESVSAEREACAKVCEEVGEHPSLTPRHCAEAIRARGQHD